MCHFINTIDYTILPTIRPDDYLFEHNKHLGKEKWQIFANVVRKIYAEIGGFEEVDMGMRDLNRYIKAMRTGFYDPFENIDYEHKNKDDQSTKSSVAGTEINKKIEIDDEEKMDQINTKTDEKDDILEINENNEKKENILEENIDDEKKEKEEKKDDKEDDDILDENRNEAEEKLLIE